jgi:hypothetical protein
MNDKLSDGNYGKLQGLIGKKTGTEKLEEIRNFLEDNSKVYYECFRVAKKEVDEIFDVIVSE